jgi:predicted nucleic acid-binding protein
VLLDTGPLVAVLDEREQSHAWAVSRVGEVKLPVWTCGAVIAETCFLLAQHRPALAKLSLLVRNGDIRPVDEDGLFWSRAFSIMERYANVRTSFADACLVAMADRHTGAQIFTLDRDFLIYRDGKGKPLSVIAPFVVA